MQIQTIWQIQQVLSSQILLFQVLWLLSECINLGILASIHQGYPFISTLIQSNIRTTHIVRNIHILIHYKVLSYSPRFPDVTELVPSSINTFIIKKSVLAVSSIYFTWREPTMCKEVHSQVDRSDMRSISHLLLLFPCVWQLRDLH